MTEKEPANRQNLQIVTASKQSQLVKGYSQLIDTTREETLTEKSQFVFWHEPAANLV